MVEPSAVERNRMDVDIVCVGFGPAMGGFLTTLSRAFNDPSETPLQVICYERADDLGFGVSGVVTRARSIKASFPDFNPADIPMAFPAKHEKVVYLLDPIGASRRSKVLRFADGVIRSLKKILPFQNDAVELPFIPPFMRKDGGFILSLGQFNQWVSSQITASGAVQIWPGMPVSEPLFDQDKVIGIRLADQGTDKSGKPEASYMPGMDIHAGLTVVGDGSVGAVGQKLDRHFGLPKGNHQREWAVGMKMVVELPEGCALEPGTVIHTLGFPEPEIFGFLYVYPDRLASLGIFVPSWFDSPVRTSYRYLQHWMKHPYLWKHLEGGVLKSWGAKSLQESGKRGEPFLAGDGFARIGEGSGSTNVLTGSGVDEAWATGTMLAEGVIDLVKEKKPFTQKNLEEAYVKRRRASWVEEEAKVAEHARDGFQHGFLPGLFGMVLAGFTGGKLHIPARSKRPHERIPTLEKYFKNKISAAELAALRVAGEQTGATLHDVFMERLGWPKIELDGKLLVSHQDALLMGGKVQAPSGFADHVRFLNSDLCKHCHSKVCIELCSGQAITASEDGGVPQFDREKCVYCGACLWNCAQPREGDPEHGNIEFLAGAGGLHSAIN